jgi:hypothetical protein
MLQALRDQTSGQPRSLLHTACRVRASKAGKGVKRAIDRCHHVHLTTIVKIKKNPILGLHAKYRLENIHINSSMAK